MVFSGVWDVLWKIEMNFRNMPSFCKWVNIMKHDTTDYNTLPLTPFFSLSNTYCSFTLKDFLLCIVFPFLVYQLCNNGTLVLTITIDIIFRVKSEVKTWAKLYIRFKCHGGHQTTRQRPLGIFWAILFHFPPFLPHAFRDM